MMMLKFRMPMRMIKLTLCVMICIGLALAQNKPGRVHMIGNDLEARVTGVEYASVIFLLNDILPPDGVIFAFSAFFRAQTKVHYQIWRPVNATSSGANGQNFILLADFPIMPTMDMQREDMYIESLLSVQCVRVQSTDRVGVFFEEAPGAVAYAFDATHPEALASTLKNSSAPYQEGEEVTFDPLTFPYDFSVVAYVDTDLSGVPDDADRPDCPKGLLIPDYIKATLPPTTTTTPPTGAPGATGPAGPRGPPGPKGDPGKYGATGATGPAGKDGKDGKDGMDGKDGKDGPVGPPGPPGSAGNSTNSLFGSDPLPKPAVNSQLSNPWMTLAPLIWLAVLTLIVLIVIIIVIQGQRKREEDKRRHESMNGGNGIYVQPTSLENVANIDGRRDRLQSSKSDAPEPQWISGMREESESQFSHDTIQKNDVKSPHYIDMTSIQDNSEIHNY